LPFTILHCQFFFQFLMHFLETFAATLPFAMVHGDSPIAIISSLMAIPFSTLFALYQACFSCYQDQFKSSDPLMGLTKSFVCSLLSAFVPSGSCVGLFTTNSSLLRSLPLCRSSHGNYFVTHMYLIHHLLSSWVVITELARWKLMFDTKKATNPQ